MKLLSDKIKKYRILVLLLIIVFGVIRLCYFFSLRDGHHVDETWSYGFANSYYDPYIYSESRYGGVTDQNAWKNLNVWLPGSLFNDYITVDEKERFSFDSVLYNKEYDLGPALYPLILHFICSFFPGSFSWFYAFFINLICFVCALIFVYLISFEISDSIYIGLFSTFFYTLSGCGTGNYLYLRVYALFTFFVLALLYTMVKFIKKKNKFINFFFLPVLTILGCMTHYYYLVIAFFLTLFSILVLFLKKKFIDGIKLGFTMLVSVALFFLLYRPAFIMLLPYFAREASVGGSTGYSTSYRWNISAANMHFFQGTVGFFIDFNVPFLLSAFGVICFCAITFALIVFLFRNESWFKRLVVKCKSVFYGFAQKLVFFIKKIDMVLWIPVISSIAYFFIIPHSVALSTMGYIERYLFASMAIFLIAYLSIAGSVLTSIIQSKLKCFVKYSIVCAMIICMLILSYRSNMFTDEFKFTEMNEKELAGLMEGKKCYVMIHAVRDMIWLSPELANTDESYIDLAIYVPFEDHTIPTLDSDCYILLNLGDFLTEDQKETYVQSGDIELLGLNRPSVYMTADDYVDMVEEQNGLSYSKVKDFPTFIGNLRLYKVSDEDYLG